ncbi:MAG: NAD-dependent epimerase/dehydratase family protein [Thermoanaerobaculia bacterium]
MKVFITGGTGYIGSAVAAELLRAGHEVTGLTSSEAKVRDLERAGVQPVVGDLGDPGTWRREAARAEGLVHAAFDYGADDPVERDGLAIDGLLSAATEGNSHRTFVYTSGVWVLGNTGDDPADETWEPAEPLDLVAWRPAHEQAVLDAGRRVTPAVVRPGVVYGERRGLMVRFFQSAENEGASSYIGDGRNRMALIHRDDNARLYREILEKAASGMFHAVDGTPITMAEVAVEAGRAAGAPGEPRSVPLEEARQELGPVADALCLDQVVAARRSAEVLGWAPRYRSFREGAAPAYREWKGA